MFNAASTNLTATFFIPTILTGVIISLGLAALASMVLPKILNQLQKLLRMCTKTMSGCNSVANLFQPSERIKTFCQPWYLTNDQINSFTRLMEKVVTNGLHRSRNRKPVGSCTARCESICGFKNLRDFEESKFISTTVDQHAVKVTLLHLNPEAPSPTILYSTTYPLNGESHPSPKTGQDFIDLICSCVVTFLSDFHLMPKIQSPVPFAMTLKVPVHQITLANVILTNFFDGFDYDDILGSDFGDLINTTLKDHDVNLKIASIINHSAAGLLAAMFHHSDCKIFINLIDCLSISYVKYRDLSPRSGESRQDLEQWDLVSVFFHGGDVDDPWGFVRNDHDQTIDICSRNTGHQIINKLMSENYLGELVRSAIFSAVEGKILIHFEDTPNEKSSKKTTCHSSISDNVEGNEKVDSMRKKGQFYSRIMSNLNRPGSILLQDVIEILSDGDIGSSHKSIEKIGNKLEVEFFTHQDFIDIQYICRSVMERFLDLISATLVAILDRVRGELELIRVINPLRCYVLALKGYEPTGWPDTFQQGFSSKNKRLPSICLASNTPIKISTETSLSQPFLNMIADKIHLLTDGRCVVEMIKSENDGFVGAAVAAAINQNTLLSTTR